MKIAYGGILCADYWMIRRAGNVDTKKILPKSRIWLSMTDYSNTGTNNIFTGFSKEDNWILKRGIALALHIKVTQ
jgi:hypothetical protein